PNKPCTDCTFQLIQSMEENPLSPTFYYSCADIKILAAYGATPTPTPAVDPGDPGQTTQSSNSPLPGAQMGGCGTIGAIPPGGPGSGAAPMITTMAFMFLSAMIYLRLRLRRSPR